MASPREKVVSSSSKTPREKGSSMTHRSSLLDKMLAEDYDESPQTEELTGTPEPLRPPPGFLKGNLNPTFESEWTTGQSFTEAGFTPLPVVPSKKQQEEAGLLEKLLCRRHKGKRKSKKLNLAFSSCWRKQKWKMLALLYNLLHDPLYHGLRYFVA